MEPRRINPGDWLADAPRWMKGMDPKRLVVHVEVTEQGGARHCSVVASSGDALLDRAGCWLTTINARYEPARDANGKAVASEDQLAFRLVPTAPPPAQNADALRHNEQGLVRMSLTMGVDGYVNQCAIIQSSSSAILDSTSCQLMIKRFRAIPPQNEKEIMSSSPRRRPSTGSCPTDIGGYELVCGPFLTKFALAETYGIARGFNSGLEGHGQSRFTFEGGRQKRLMLRPRKSSQAFARLNLRIW